MGAKALLMLLSVAVVAAGCATTAPGSYRVHYRYLESPAAVKPKKVVLLPISVRVSEASAGGVIEEVRGWTEQANHNVRRAIKRYTQSNPEIRMVAVGILSARERELIDQHLALYDVVAGNAYQLTRYAGTSAWRHKLNRFDYTLGNGLQFLQQKTGADAAFIVVGNQVVSSGGRRAMAAFFMFFGGAYIPTGYTFLSIGLVDLSTGDILWFNYNAPAGGGDLRNPDYAANVVGRILRPYPGIDSYKKAILGTRN